MCVFVRACVRACLLACVRARAYACTSAYVFIHLSTYFHTCFHARARVQPLEAEKEFAETNGTRGLAKDSGNGEPITRRVLGEMDK